MRASRRLSLSAHGAVESMCGIAIMLSPLVLPVGAAGLVVLGLTGAIVAGTGLGVISSAPRAGALPVRRESVRTHTGIDGLLIIASALGALGLAIAGEAPAALALAALVTVQAALSFTTRYTTSA